MLDPEAVNVRDGIFVPAGIISDEDFVYDSSGKLVDASREYYSNAPSQLSEQIMRSSHNREGSVIFLGKFDMKHYGHWLTDGLSRYWYLLDHQLQNGIAMSWGIRRRISHLHALHKPLRPRHWPMALEAFNIEEWHLHKLTKPTRYSEIVVPYPSMVLESSISPCHFKVLQRIAQRIVTKPVDSRHGKTVYLSRRLLKKSYRSFENEATVENFCRSRGIEIVHPERLSLPDQIKIISEAGMLIGFPGSAFHTVMLRRSLAPIRCIYLSGGFEHNSIRIIDSAMGNESSYIDCCVHKRSGRIYSCDARKAISGLRKLLGPEESI